MAKMRRTGLAVLMTGLLITSVGYGTSWAGTMDTGGGDDSDHSKSDDSDHHDEDSIKGDGESFGKFQFHAKNSSDDPFKASGYFESQGPTPLTPFFGLNGPITCLDVDGDRAGFIYTITDDSKPFLLKHLEVKVAVEEGQGGAPDRIAFGIGVPAGTLHDCAPGATMNDVTSGYIEVKDRHEGKD